MPVPSHGDPSAFSLYPSNVYRRHMIPFGVSTLMDWSTAGSECATYGSAGGLTPRRVSSRNPASTTLFSGCTPAPFGQLREAPSSGLPLPPMRM